MTASHFGHPRRSRDALDLTNPNFQSGLWTTPRDFSRFLMMMAMRGKVEGQQVYPAAAIELIERDYAKGLPHRWQGGGAEGGRSYGFALWCEQTNPDGTCPVVSSGGAWGTMPWIDRERDLWGLFFVYDRGPRMRPDLDVLRDAAEALAGSGN
jgi:CubicO group peptidase (beta-lactamase class C family)